jgi:hypothetical protein
VSYSGSDKNFNYIVLTYGDGMLRHYETFKVHAGDLGLKQHMQVKRIPSEWVNASAYFPFPPPAERVEPSAH